MSVFINTEKDEIIATCGCGYECENAIHIKIVKDEVEEDVEPIFSYLAYMNGNFYRDQEDKAWMSIARKIKKIWAIIRNKDFYYSEIFMTKKDFIEFQKYINDIKVD